VTDGRRSEVTTVYHYSTITNNFLLLAVIAGKALQAFELLGLVHLSSIVDCCQWMRDNHMEVEKEQGAGGERRGRTEYIPIEWHERFNRVSRQNDDDIPSAGLNDISLNTIPHMRSFANDAMLDTLYFMSER